MGLVVFEVAVPGTSNQHAQQTEPLPAKIDRLPKPHMSASPHLQTSVCAVQHRIWFLAVSLVIAGKPGPGDW
ncbi:MAG: hypothetical protein ACI9ON_003231, partial [Limisphaerales bacterium]